MTPSLRRALLFLILVALMPACVSKGILIPLENDLSDQISTKTFLKSLNSNLYFQFERAPDDFAPQASFEDWTDEDVAALSRKAEATGIDVIAFGRVVDVHTAIGFLKQGCDKRTDMRFEFFTIIYSGRHPTLERVLTEYMQDKTAR